MHVGGHIYICMGGIQGAARRQERTCFPLLEPRHIIAFDPQINRESVHLLGGDAGVMDERISGEDNIRFAQNY